MPTKLRERAHSEAGFTLVELLVVILIIGILAAIALPAFLGQRGRAQDAEAKSAVRTAHSAAETYFTDRQTYVGLNTTRLRAIEPTLNTGVAAGTKLTITGVSATGYTVSVTSRTGTIFRIAKASNPTAKPPTVTVTRSCTVADKYGCRANLRW